MQCIGRGVRLHPGKEDCYVLDLTDSQHDISAPVDLGTVWTQEMAEEAGVGVVGYHWGGDRTTAKSEWRPCTTARYC